MIRLWLNKVYIMHTKPKEKDKLHIFMLWIDNLKYRENIYQNNDYIYYIINTYIDIMTYNIF